MSLHKIWTNFVELRVNLNFFNLKINTLFLGFINFYFYFILQIPFYFHFVDKNHIKYYKITNIQRK